MIYLAIFSVVGFVGSLVTIPWILVRLPENYFDMRVPRVFLPRANPAARAIAIVAKNLVGIVLLLAGIAMLVLPGQGVLTILIGVSLMDFPKKRLLEAKLIGQPLVFSGINRLRARFNKPPLTLDR
ncbi:MAG: hypothetical protein JF610_16495 [Acidobacteria bacterium]|nr:hypothetical protein [Acidobacteriota bacterium]